MADETLSQLEKLMHDEGLDAVLTVATEEARESLQVYFGLDPKGRQRMLQITCQPQDFLASLQEGKEGLFLGAEKIEFLQEFPFRMRDETADDVRSLVSFLNRLMELPGLEVDEVENRIYYRYVWLCYRDTENLKLALRVVGAIFLILEGYSGILEPLADGSQSLDELLEQVMTASDEAMSALSGGK